MGDNSGKTKNMRQLFFHEESIYEVSRQYLKPPYIHTHTDKLKPICPHFFKVGGIMMGDQFGHRIPAIIVCFVILCPVNGLDQSFLANQLFINAVNF